MVAQQLEYRARGAAAALFRTQSPEVLMDGPAGTGKTRAILEKINWLCESYPGIRVLVARATRVSMTESVLVTWENKVLWQGHPAITGDASRANRHSYTYPNGSEVICGGLDNPDRIMSTEYDVVAVFEATECGEEAWEKLLTRLRNGVLPFQQAIADCNPSFPGHWLNKRASKGRMLRLKSRHADNPSVTPAYIETLKALTGHRRARLFEGLWAAGEGTVFPEFASRHIVTRPFDIPEEWPIFVGWDPGYDHPTAILWLAVSPNDTIYVFDEIYRGGLDVPAHCANIRQHNTGRTVKRYYADPQHAFSSTAQSPASIAMQAKKCGITLTPWPRSTHKEPMVEAVRALLINDRIKVFATCANTIDEFQSWRYKRNAKGEALAGDDQYEDANNDAMDVVCGMVAANIVTAGGKITVTGG